MLFFQENIALIHPSWIEFFSGEAEEEYMRRLQLFLNEEEKRGAVVYPRSVEVFSAFRYTPLDQVKVVVVGQDPYHGAGQAHGLSFSVPEGVAQPPSLKNIFKELSGDLGVAPPPHGSLVGWARQGVLLLNATLTVREGEPKSHYGQGWETFTDRVIQKLCLEERPMVFLLWGKSALDKFEEIKGRRGEHLVLSAPHPSPFSAYSGFFGCSHFSKTNMYLKKMGLNQIDWKNF